LALAAFAGPDGNILVVGEASTVKTFRIKPRVPLYDVSLPIGHIEHIVPLPVDPSTVAISSAKEVCICAIADDGAVELVHKIPVIEPAQRDQAIRYLAWEIETYGILVTTSAFVAVFDAGSDSSTPTFSVPVPNSNGIVSSTILTIGETVYLVCGMIKGLRICPLFGPNPHLAPLDFPVVVNNAIVSYHEDADLFFASAPQSPVIICHGRDLIGSTPVTSFTRVGNTSLKGMEFACAHPLAPSLMIMRGLSEVMTIEFAGDGIAWGTETVSSPLASLIATGDSVLGLGSDGILVEIAAGARPGSHVVQFLNQGGDFATGPEEDGFAFKVPLSFWRHVMTSRKPAIFDEYGADLNLLVRRQPITAQGRIALTVTTVDDMAVAAVLLEFGFGGGPGVVRVENRRYVFDEPPRRYFFPLKPNEVFPGAAIRIEIEAKNDTVVIVGADVFVLGDHKENAPKVLWDWFGAGRDLTDFVDESVAKCSTDVEYISAMISGANLRYNDGDRQDVVKLIEFMYTDPDMAVLCRRMLLKACKDRSDLGEIWAEGIRDVCVSGAVNPAMVNLIWRDYAILPERGKTIVGDAIWKALGTNTTFHTMIAQLTR
jgi:hypothetical protein